MHSQSILEFLYLSWKVVNIAASSPAILSNIPNSEKKYKMEDEVCRFSRKAEKPNPYCLQKQVFLF